MHVHLRAHMCITMTVLMDNSSGHLGCACWESSLEELTGTSASILTTTLWRGEYFIKSTWENWNSASAHLSYSLASSVNMWQRQSPNPAECLRHALRWTEEVALLPHIPAGSPQGWLREKLSPLSAVYSLVSKPAPYHSQNSYFQIK